MKKKISVLNHVLSQIHITEVENEPNAIGRAIRFRYKNKRFRVAAVFNGKRLLVEHILRHGILSSDKWASALTGLLEKNLPKDGIEYPSY